MESVNIKKYLIRIVPALILAVVFVIVNKQDTDALICTSGVCYTNNQWVNSYVRIDGGSCHYINYYSCNGNPNNCQEDHVDTYSNSSCTVKTHDDYGCCASGPPPPPPCTDCTPDSCSGNYSSTSDLGYGSKVLSCSNDCGTQTRTCYCTSACTPASCPAGYSTTNLGVGSGPRQTCTNACSVTNNRYCYKYPCNDCTLSCPSVSPMPALTLTNTSYPVIDVSCTRGGDCGGPIRSGTCYENVSAQPFLVSMAVNSPAGGATTLAFTSTTTSGVFGSGANQPVNITSTFRDSDGRDDIEAISFWFTTGASVPNTPTYINVGSTAPSAKTPNTSNFGFMLHKEVVGGLTSWVPYVPSMEVTESTTDRWVRANTSGSLYNIAGPSGSTMVQVSNISVVNNADSRDKVVTFSLQFMSGTGYEAVASGNYNVFTMAHDVFSFTPRDNYSASGITNTNWNNGEIRNPRVGPVSPNYARRWFDSTHNWYIDLTPPVVDSFTVSVSGDYLVLDWNITETQGVYGVVGNIYRSSNLNEESLDIISLNGTPTSGLSYTPVDEGSNTIGHLSNGYAFRIYSSSLSGSAVIDPNNNNGGSLIFYITVFDRGGNARSSSIAFNLGDWFLTRGGLLYSSDGVSVETRNLLVNPWTSLLASILTNPPVGFSHNSADISSEMSGSKTLNRAAIPLLHSTTLNSSYEITRLQYPDNDVEFFDDFYGAFEQKLPKLISMELYEGDFTGNLCNVDGCYKYKMIPGDESVSSFTCNGKGIFFVEGNLSITPGLRNTTEREDACIFIVRGNVTVEPGSDVSSGGDTGYDEVNAFILVNGTLTVPYDPNNDGLLIKGGIYSPNNEIVIERRILLANRNEFPVLAVSNNSKYGIFSKDLFGNKISLVKTEVGFKPY